ncbi:glycoside hydrolase family 115 protein [Pseudocercospora fijiensis CIRAD86]|uniref:Glycoside hydrolase family 115 protein n=1 Tax=Pseudocercospora fijiensis (strain CIRAD86) TaxID=383855 RepID=M2ZHH3_PSEFD|nr:glycoside hydrolase family 115 protein [Pseudocercospora fijiensis CIRAD86]EME78589.1 glycoside hydrolase family 115 protein [Pseudocercospora fijiensis CIRAD86]
MFEDIFVQFGPGYSSVELNNAPLIISSHEPLGIKSAVHNLALDFGRVLTKRLKQTVVEADTDLPKLEVDTAIIIGCLESSHLVQDMVSKGKLDVESISGRWESFCTSVVAKPFEGIAKALVIVGSDKRGTIYGAYTLSEQIGVSPWYWWADVPPKQHSAIYAIDKSTCHGEPSIKYRGIFLNDEAPVLTGWVLEKFGKYNSQFYEKVFELILRLKANFLWPAMWPGYPNPGASFFTDDSRNQALADELGIVISTSHHEPMQRLSNEWFAENPDGSWNWLTNKDRITDFFREGVQRAAGKESYFTLGMRDVIQTQRQLFKEEHGAEDAVPQVLACYKEVQTMYESGKLEVPDHVTLLFGDDNFGTIRRLPSVAERKRRDGAGIYYHLEYVGWPRSYKWINSNSLGKIKHQLMQAYHRQARQIWVFNVGDLKPVECPLSFAIAVAWNCEAVRNIDVKSFHDEWATQNLNTKIAQSAAEVLCGYDRIASIRKHELIEPTTFSILNYRESEILLDRLSDLLQQASTIYEQADEAEKATCFQLILHPVKATWIYYKIQILRSKNRLYARQRRNSANRLAQEILDLFEQDFDLSEEYHSLLNGKWNHMLRQPHYGYEDTWHAPSRDMIDGLCYVQKRQHSNPIAGNMGVAVEGHEGVRPGRCNEESDRTHPSRRDLVPGVTFQALSRYSTKNRWFEIYTRGPRTIHWYVTTPKEWLKFSNGDGMLGPDDDDVRIEINVDWDLVPDTFEEEILIDVKSKEGDFEQLHLPITARKVPKTITPGFIEADGYVSIPATASQIHPPYRVLLDTGRLPTGSISLDTSTHIQGDDLPFLTYTFYNFTVVKEATLIIYFGTTLILSPDETLQYDLQVDDGPVATHDLYSVSAEAIQKSKDEGWPAADGWFEAAGDNVWVNRHIISGEVLTPGRHDLRFRLRHSNMLLEKLVLDLGGVGESYLGPLASLFLAQQ